MDDSKFVDDTIFCIGRTLISKWMRPAPFIGHWQTHSEIVALRGEHSVCGAAATKYQCQIPNTKYQIPNTNVKYQILIPNTKYQCQDCDDDQSIGHYILDTNI